MPNRLVAEYGPFWARNDQNLHALKRKIGNQTGVYLLYCGWHPVYVGRGKVYSRIKHHMHSKTKVWDRFTWFVLDKSQHSRELEAIFLRSLPFYLRVHNRQGAHINGIKSLKTEHATPVEIRLPKMLPNKNRRRKL